MILFRPFFFFFFPAGFHHDGRLNVHHAAEWRLGNAELRRWLSPAPCGCFGLSGAGPVKGPTAGSTGMLY